jgi:integrase
MSVFKQNGTWRVNISCNGQRVRRKSPENSRNGALIHEGLLLGKLNAGEHIDDVKETSRPQLFSEFAEEWIEKYAKVHNKNSEIIQKISILKVHLNPFFGNHKISQINNKMINDYKAKKLEDGRLASKTVNNHLAVLSKLFNTAQEWEIIDKTPKIKMLKLPPQNFDFLSYEEQEFLLSKITGLYHDMVLLVIETGLRISEVTALKWEDINFQNKLLTVNRAKVKRVIGSPKSNRTRQIDLTDRLYEVLLSGKEKKGFVFENEKGNPVVSETARRNLKRICNEIGLRKVGWHMLRHTFASRLAERNAPLIAIQRLLGHATIDMTMRYAHLSPSTLKSSIELLNPNSKKTSSVTEPSPEVFQITDYGKS